MIKETNFSVSISKIWITVILHVFLLAFTGCQETTEFNGVVDGTNLTKICNQPDNELSVNFENMGLTRVRSKFLSSPHVVALSLRSNGISKIAYDAFARLPNLCYLDLSMNPSELAVFYLEYPAKLKVLVLDSINVANNRYYNYPYEQPVKLLRTYPDVEYLYLRNNGLSNIDPRWELLFPNVKHLFLSHNNFEQGSLSNIRDSVTHLYIEYNMITTFRIEKIANLVSLSLDGNNIRSINSYYDGLYLHGAVNLEVLSVAANGITEISHNAFTNINNLRSLNLSHNEISNLHREVFLNTLNLETLLLNNNKLSTIPQLCDLQNLTSLSLQYNRIKSVSANSFCDTMVLKYLNLAGNQMSNLELNAFHNINTLEVLDLSDNNLHELPVDWNISLNSLTHLYLNDNYFEDLDNLFLSNFSSLQNLYLKNNSITTLNTDSFREIKNLNLHLIQTAKPYNVLPRSENPYELQ